MMAAVSNDVVAALNGWSEGGVSSFSGQYVKLGLPCPLKMRWLVSPA